MNRLSQAALAAVALIWSSPAMAVDSYRYLHVTINTPWMIFVFLFFLVFAPMILSAILYIRNALHRDKEEGGEENGNAGARHD